MAGGCLCPGEVFDDSVPFRLRAKEPVCLGDGNETAKISLCVHVLGH